MGGHRFVPARLSLAVLAICLTSGASVRGVEPWSDQALKVTDGLVVWLDGAAQAAGRQRRGDIVLRDGDPLEHWLDSSGAKRNLVQADEKKRPTVRLDGDLAMVRFDGRGSHLALSGLKTDLAEATVVIVAAPFRNEGNFSGLLSMHADGSPDFESGMNIDQGPFYSEKFEILNVEGAGFRGVNNLCKTNGAFLKLRRMSITSTVGPAGVALSIDGEAQGARARTDSTMRVDELIVGARLIDPAQGITAFLTGEIAEILAYDRVLSTDELATVDRYLAAKYEKAAAVPPPAEDSSFAKIERVENPPPVQVFVPGFTVRDLPVSLSNINNVLYREDGKLVALAYDGHVYVLTDTDGDGFEDRADLFWENKGQLRAPIGMALTPPGYARGRGVFVASKSKVSLLLDADGDDRAEEEVIVATGWPELWTQVDALGVAVDPRDQSIYFGLGTWNFTNAYQVGDDGNAVYKLTDEHGTILRVAPDFKTREIVCTGIRFPVALRFNKDNELFCTDQEGATWLPNGNPFDELLHIEMARHYGFPPRHPRHLPTVIDEPSVFNYKPQHLSTCGLNFNDPATDGTIFGPDWWTGDAFVASYSRGKLFRTKLARTSAGYVAQNQLLAALNRLTCDACVGPKNSLVVATHSGGGDWGSGPAGDGKLYKITYDPNGPAIPSLAWPESPQEVRIAFDRPVTQEQFQDLAARVVIDGGEHATAGERFESKRPGYAVVMEQLRAPRSRVAVQSVQLTADRRTLILTTSPHSSAVNYAVRLPGVVPQGEQGAPTANGNGKPMPPALPQAPDIDLQYDLTGVAATWTSAASEPAWSGWLPHLSSDVAREFTKASAEHDQLWARLNQPGTLTLRTALNLADMLRPAVQPGSHIDYQLPPEFVTLTFESNGPLEITLDGATTHSAAAGSGKWVGRITTPGISPEDEKPGNGPPSRHELELRLTHNSSAQPASVAVSYHTHEDQRPRALPLERLLLPWARPAAEPPQPLDNRNVAELKGGNWLRGHAEFFGSEAGCSKCHQMRGEGGKIGPDLSNLPQRDYASVLRDVTQPSFAINPDFVTQTLLLNEGRVLAGTVRADGDRLIIADQEGKETIVHSDDVESLEHSPQSIMPEGIPKALGPERLRDLLTFLLIAPPQMPVYGEAQPPVPRAKSEVDAVLAGAPATPSHKPLHVVLVSGPKDHGIGEHDYPAWQTVWKSLLEMAEGVRVTTADKWPTSEDFDSADAIVFYQQGDWTAERATAIDAYLARGGGLSYIHYAVDGGKDAPGFAQRIGLAWQGGRSKFRHGPLDVQFVPGSDHPIARNFGQVHFHDESYWNSVGDPKRVNLLATGVEEGAPQPLFWTIEHGKGRVFVSIPGHFSWTFDDPLFRTLLLRGLAWSAGEPVDRFNALVWPGARVRPE